MIDKKIVLVGYMGVGKSFVGKKLAEKLNFTFVDLDNLIEKNENLAIKEIFKQKGEIYFRKLEHQILKDFIDHNNNFVLSTGGGTPCYADNYKLIENINSFYLKANVQTLYERLISEKHNRPLIAHIDDAELKNFIGQHLFERSFYYQKSKFTVDVDDRNLDNIIDDIILKYKN